VRAGLQIVVRGEQATGGGTQAEGRKHASGDVLQLRLLHLLIGRVGDVDALSVGDGEQFGVALHGVAHALKRRIRPAVERLRLAVEADSVAREGVELLGRGHRQGPQQQRVDEAEGGGAGADRETERENRCG
jgi:hypothetical protein